MISAMLCVVSSPTKSSSVSGPIGYPHPSCIALSMSGTLPTPRSTARIASSRYGTSSRLTMKPELSFAATGSLRSEAANAKARLNVSSEVVTVRTTSTSGISGTGLKKCRPTKRSPRFVAAAISAIVRLEVFGDRLDDDVRFAEVRNGRRERQPLENLVAIRGLELALLDEFAERLLDAGPAAIEDLFRDVTNGCLIARGRRDLGDPAPHQAATEHTNSLDVGHELRSAPGLRARTGRIFECLAHFVGEPRKGLRARQDALAGGAHLALLQAVEHLLQRDLHALVRRPVGARDHGAAHSQSDARSQREQLRERERGSDEHRARRHPPADHRHDGRAGNALGALLMNVGLEPHQAESGLELHDLRRDLRCAPERVAPPAGKCPLNRGERAGLWLPRCPVGVVALGLEQFLFGHPAAQRLFDGRAIARDDSVCHDRARAGEPRPRAGPAFRRGARLLFQHRLAEIAVGDPDVFAKREDLAARQPITDVPLSGLQFGGALDDALQRLAADELLPHQTLAFLLLRGAGRRSLDVVSGSARLPESEGAMRSIKPLKRSIGMGKIVVELFSEAISLTVCR